MRSTQQDQIKEAKHAYLITLNDPRDGMSTLRFSVYLSNGNGKEMDVLWPSDSHEGKKSKELLHGQVYSQKKQYPAYHFAFAGCGYSKSNEIRVELQRINPKIEVYSLNGGSPSQA